MINWLLNLKSYKILILGFFTLLPFFILSFYNNPSADDFWFATRTNELGFFNAQIWWHNEWTGRYFSCAILSINPLVFNCIIGYKIIPIILIILISSSLYLLINELTSKSLQIINKLNITIILIVLYLYQMPSIAEGFYWMSGSVSYLFNTVLTIYLFIVIIRLNKTDKIVKKLKFFFLSIFLIIAIVGSNEILMTLLLLLLISIFIINIFTNHKFDWLLFFFIIITSIACYFVITAPGNINRLGCFPNKYNLYLSIFNSIVVSFEYISKWLGNTLIILFTIVFIPLGLKISNHQNITKCYFAIHPVISIFIFIILIFSSFFTIYWATGGSYMPILRAINVIYLLFLIGWFYNIQVIIHYLNKKSNIKFNKLPNYVLLMVIFLLIIILIKPNNIRTAYEDLLKGSAYRYNKELNERYKAIELCNSDICEVESLKNYPKSLFYMDISHEENDWRNIHYASYFHKKAIRIKNY